MAIEVRGIERRGRATTPTGPMRRRRGLGSRALALCATLGLAVGCSSDDGRPETYPVAGQVQVGGEPAAGAFVVFHPAGTVTEEFNKPTAQVKSDGSFELTTFDEADGAPAGEYAVTVEWRKLVDQGGDVQAGPNVVPDTYARADSTPLKVTVAENPNTLDPFQIQPRR